jgi:hypothetical protein
MSRYLWTDEIMGIIDWMMSVYGECDDVEWWEGWQHSYDVGVVYMGWRECMSERSLYTRRMELVDEYMVYRSWWRSESMRPRAVSLEE